MDCKRGMKKGKGLKKGHVLFIYLLFDKAIYEFRVRDNITVSLAKH